MGVGWVVLDWVCYNENPKLRPERLEFLIAHRVGRLNPVALF